MTEALMASAVRRFAQPCRHGCGIPHRPVISSTAPSPPVSWQGKCFLPRWRKIRVTDSRYPPNPPHRGRPGRIYRDDVPLSTLAGNIMLVGARVFEDGHEEGF